MLVRGSEHGVDSQRHCYSHCQGYCRSELAEAAGSYRDTKRGVRGKQNTKIKNCIWLGVEGTKVLFNLFSHSI